MISICIRAIDDGYRKVPIVLYAPQLHHGERHSRWLGMGQVHSSQISGLWLSRGVATTSHEYQLLISDHSFYSGFFISGYTNCYKRCNSWCGDTLTPYFRSASTHSGYAGVAFNVNGHRLRSSRLMSVGLR